MAGFINEFSEKLALEYEIRAIAEPVPRVPTRGLEPWLDQVSIRDKDHMILLILGTLSQVEELSIYVI